MPREERSEKGPRTPAMARFTFGAGNARKVLRLPLYALGALATLVVPRSQRLWVFGCGIGVGEGALPLYRAARERLGADTRLVWLATTDAELAEARELGLDAVRKSGWRGFWLTLRARVLVVTHGFGDVNRFATRGGFVVQLWHGIPLKRLHLDSPATLRVSFLPDHRLVRAFVTRAYRLAGRGIQLFPVASELVAARVASAFGMPPSRIVVTGDPRDDALTAPRAAPVLEADARHTILYAPTWRDGAPDPVAPTAEQWDAIAAWLEKRDAVLYLRAHPLGAGDYAAGPARSQRVRMLGADRVRDVNVALPEIDVLLTDYSSIAFDFALLGKPTVFLAADLEQYAKRRGLYDSYREFSGGRYATGWEGALDQLGAALDGDAEAVRHSAWLRDEYVDVSGDATGRVLDEILARTGGPAAPPVELRLRPIVAIESAEGSTLRLTISGGVTAARLEGRRARVDGILSSAGDLTVAEFELLGPRWGADRLALPSDAYRVQLATPAGWSSRAVMTASTELEHELFRATVGAQAGGVVVTVAAPLAADERGAVAQRRLEHEYRRSHPKPEDAVFFESFYGQSASCNPLGVDRALAELRPEVRRYWSVVDGSVAVPDGAVRIIEGSRAWWKARAAARALVVNDWLRKRYRRRRHQKVLQTWHGTMLKKLALDRGGRGVRTRIAVLRERNRWDALLAQNPYSAEIFSSAYAMRRPIWQEGYPRNDVLHSAGRAATVRAAIGIPDGARVVLYAPTWRDDRKEMVDFVDLAVFARDLDGSGEQRHVVLARGHSRTLAHGQDLEGAGLIDVTSYPDMADLLLVADVLVTDYSSVMFDFAGTGRPIVFFTPDLAHYSADLRGFYFDLLAEAPGPVVSTRDELREAILAAADGQPEYASRAAAWRERFTPRDDGAAGRRVVERMLAEGWL